ncbi:hypothetical protein M422DRAFT_192885, partial [Sphaerobolus stellatus SS14]
LPLLNAIVNEVLRLSTPFFLPRVLPSDGMIIDGQHIPGDTIVGIAKIYR